MARPSCVLLCNHYYVGHFNINLTGKELKQNKHSWRRHRQGVMTNCVYGTTGKEFLSVTYIL